MVLCHRKQKKPTWQNTRRHSTTSAYSSTNPSAKPSCSSFSHPTSVSIRRGPRKSTALDRRASSGGLDRRRASLGQVALVLLPVALAIALLLRPVARQLRHVERAAQTIAAGDLTARVDQRRVPSAKSLAHALLYAPCEPET